MTAMSRVIHGNACPRQSRFTVARVGDIRRETTRFFVQRRNGEGPSYLLFRRFPGGRGDQHMTVAIAIFGPGYFRLHVLEYALEVLLRHQ